MIKKITVEVIDHNAQRYETVGDYQLDGDTLVVKVSDLGSWRQNMLVAVHEIIEGLICVKNGVPLEMIDEFDMKFEQMREAGLIEHDEPGDDPRAPYYFAHQVASAIERLMAKELGVVWRHYEVDVGSMKKDN